MSFFSLCLVRINAHFILTPSIGDIFVKVQMLGVNGEALKNKIALVCHKGRMWQLYSRSNPLKSPALGAGNVSEPRLSQWFAQSCARRSVCFSNQSVGGASIRLLNHLTPNDHFSGRTAPLTSRCCIFFIYSTNIRTEYFKHAAFSLVFFFLFKMPFIS